MSLYNSENIKKFPFVRLLFPLILGIATQLYFPFHPHFVYILSISLFLIVILFFNIRFPYRLRFAFGLVLFLTIFILGCATVTLNTPSAIPDSDKNMTMTAEVINTPIEKDSSIRCILQLKSINANNSKFPAGQRIIAYFKKDGNSDYLQYQDNIVLYGTLQKIKNPGNPEEFDYKSYLFRQYITGQIFVKSKKFRILSHNRNWTIFKTAETAKNKLADLYKSYGISGQEYAVLAALTLGDQTEIDPEIKTAFAISGTTHVLSVSGMHVGLIYLVFNFFLRFLDRFRTKKFAYGSLLKAVILIAFLFFYSVLTGMSPSVRRATVMFSFFIIGSFLQKQHQIYNTMSASAFILLLINPFLITDVGFQLSYLAVFSIVFLQKNIENLLHVKNLILKKIWVLTSVSIAAQIITTPLTLFYFHQFPNWFWLTNLIVIPLTSVIIYAAIALLAVSPFPILAVILSKVVKFLLVLLNDSVRLVEKLPFAATKNIAFEHFDLIFWYLILIFVLIFIFKKQFRFFAATLVIFAFYISLNLYFNIEKSNSKIFAVYNIKGKSLYTLFSKDQNLLVSDTLADASAKDVKFAINGFLQKLNANTCTSLSFNEIQKKSKFYKNKKYIDFEGIKIYIVNEKKQLEYTVNRKLKIDYLILSGNIYVSMKELQNLFETKIIIFDSSNKSNRISRWGEECKKLGIKYHSVLDNGAFVAEF
jgi:competence protein ComEC